MSSGAGSTAKGVSDRRVVAMDEIELGDVASVGPKHVSLARMLRLTRGDRPGGSVLGGAQVPEGFVITAAGAADVFAAAGVSDHLRDLMTRVRRGSLTEHQGGHSARELILGLAIPGALQAEIAATLAGMESGTDEPVLLAVRSSAVAEDLTGASYAGQYDSHLGVHGLEQVLDAYRSVLASLFTDRAISYRRHLAADAPDALDLAMAVGVQRLVRADLGGCAGVMLTRDPDAPANGEERLLIEAVHGLGDALVGGAVDPERYLVARTPSATTGMSERVTLVPATGQGHVLDTTQIDALRSIGLALEAEFGAPLDVEWAIDGRTDQLFLLQARAITGRGGNATSAQVSGRSDAEPGRTLTTGLAIGTGSVVGPLCVMEHALDDENFVDGAILVTGFTDPSWMHLMRRASALVTDHGGRASHAAIVARELGLLAVLGCQDATTTLAGVATAQVRCATDGHGSVHAADAVDAASEIS